MGIWNLFQGRDMAAKLSALDKSQAVIEFALDGTVLDANANFCAAMGYARDEIKGKHHSLFVAPDEAAGDGYRAFWDKLRRGVFESGEYKRIAKGGREVWLQASYNPVLDSAGRPVKVVKFAADITARKIASADAKGQVDAIGRSQAVIHFGLDGTILDANENFCAALGYTLDEIKGRHHSMFVDPSFVRSDEYRRFWERLGQGRFDAGEYKRIAKGGREVWIQASYNPIFDDAGKPFKVVKFASDVTLRKLEAAAAKGQIEAISKSQAVIRFDLDGTVEEANENFLNALGYTLAEIKGRHHSMFVDPEYARGPEYRAFWEKLRGGVYDAGEYKRVAKGGREVWIQASYNPIFDADGKPFRVVKFATDITKMMAARLNVAELVDQSTSSVHGVASAAEEMAASIQEINVNMSRSRQAVEDIVRKVNSAGDSSGALQRSSEAMGKIVELIRGIADRVNLLALNATIEAARAGEAGKGFTVVASEVKSLANQTKQATDSISGEIEAMLSVSSSVAQTVGDAVTSADLVSQYVNSVAAALEEQSTATREISGQAQNASHALSDINEQVKRIAA